MLPIAVTIASTQFDILEIIFAEAVDRLGSCQPHPQACQRLRELAFDRLEGFYLFRNIPFLRVSRARAVRFLFLPSPRGAGGETSLLLA